MEDEQLRSQVLKSMVNESRDIGTFPDDQRSPCVICLEEMSDHAITVPCTHEFDFVCIVNWLERNPTCPLCKARVQTVEYDRASRHNAIVYTVHHPSPLPATGTHTSQRFDGSLRGQQQHERQPEQHQGAEQHNSCSMTIAKDPLEHRKRVYRHQWYSHHIGSNKLSRFQELTPKRFVQDAELVSRARKWIRRELRVFEYLTDPCKGAAQGEGITRRAKNVEFLLEWIVAVLKSVDIKGSSGQAEDMLQEFIGRDNARLFLHELRAWLRSPYTSLQDWDRRVQYDETVDSLQYVGPAAQRGGRERNVRRSVDHYAPYPGSRPLRGRVV